MQLATKAQKLSLQARLLCLLVFGVSGSATIATAQSVGAFTRSGNMITARSQHIATLLPNGRVLIAGGVQSLSLSGSPVILAGAELYDPSTGTFGPTGDMTRRRRMHTSTLLADGRVLITGGQTIERAEPGLTSVLSGPLNRNDRWTVLMGPSSLPGVGLGRMRMLKFQAHDAKHIK